MKTTPNEVYFINPNTRDSKQKPINGFMEKDFTIYLQLEIYPDTLTPTDSYAFSRNGMHSGINFVKTELNEIFVKYCYWFQKENQEVEFAQVIVPMPGFILEDVNEYVMIGNNDEKKIYCYLNNENVGILDYQGKTKISYTNSFMWYSCGNMLEGGNFSHPGTFNYHLHFCLDKRLTIDEVNDIKDNHVIKYIEGINLPFLDSITPHFDNLVLFLDFKDKTKFKIWNLCFNGTYPQLYVENDIYF